jgi:methylenetetrahydrofolate reductase (NADPH)
VTAQVTNPEADRSTPPPDGQHFYSRLQRRLAAGHFAVTAEVVPPRGATLNGIKRIATHLSEWIDAANITDGQGAVARMSSWAGSIGLMQAGVEPVMQFSCRDRNRIALQADLLGAAAVGIPNVLCLTGDHPRFGDHPDARPVFDMDSVQLLWTARTLRDDKRLLSGNKLSVAPRWFIGAVENPSAAPQRFRAERLGKKIAAGAQFFQTQFVFDVPVVERWMQQVRDLGLDKRCSIIAGVGPIRSTRALEVLTSLPGVVIPDEVSERVRSTPPERQEHDAIDLCSETIQRLREIPGINGVHIIASGWDDFIPEVLTRAGIGKRQALDTPAQSAEDAAVAASPARNRSGGRKVAD